MKLIPVVLALLCLFGQDVYVPPELKPKPVPMDVSAVVGQDWQQMFGNINYDNPHEEWKVVDHWAYMRWWTCEDKSRILMMAEDGTRHCIKF